MKFKRTLSIIISILLVMLTGTTAFAEDKPANTVASTVDEKNVSLSKEDAKNIALNALKNLMDTKVDENKAQYRVELRQEYNIVPSYVWDFGWNISDGAASMDIGVCVNANTGAVISIRKYEYSPSANQPQIAKVTREQAKKTCEEFINKLNPEISGNIKFVEDDNYLRYKYGGAQPVNYNFSYIRMIDGIECPSNTVNVEVNGVTGKVQSFYCMWEDGMKIPPKDGIIDSSKALEIFKASDKFSLMYIAHRNPYYYEETPKDIKLVYVRTSEDGNLIDAKSGERIVYPAEAQVKITTVDLSQFEKEEFLKKSAEVKKLDKELDRDSAEKVLDTILKDFGYDGYTISNIRYVQNEMYSNAGGRNVWNAQFMKEDSTRPYDNGGQISIDASTGQVISLYSYSYPEAEIKSEDVRFTFAEGYKKAIDAIAKYYPNRIKDVSTEQRQYDGYYYINGVKSINPMYNYTFQRQVNGISYSDNNISAAVDVKDGRIIQLSCMWNDNIVFPDMNNIIGKEDVQKIFYESYKPVLSYTAINNSTDYAKPDMVLKLAYVLKSDRVNGYPEYIDAVNGKVVNYNGDEIKKNGNSFMDKIKGSPLEKELSIMAYQGIIDPDTFEPAKQLTKMDLVKALVSTKGYNLYLTRDAEALKFTDISKDSDDYKYLQLAVKYGIIENKAGAFSGSTKITREELAVYLIRLTNYSKLAGVKGLFTISSKDAKNIYSNYYGYVAIAKGLGIMGETNGMFRPKDNATMLEMADAIYKVMEYVKPIYY